MKRCILLGISFILLLGLIAFAVIPDADQPVAETEKLLFTKVDSLQNLTENT